jgi:hypothetical protein
MFRIIHAARDDSGRYAALHSVAQWEIWGSAQENEGKRQPAAICINVQRFAPDRSDAIDPGSRYTCRHAAPGDTECVSKGSI